MGLVSCHLFQALSTTEKLSAKRRSYPTHKNPFTPENRKGQFPLEMENQSPLLCTSSYWVSGGSGVRGAAQTGLLGRPRSHEHTLSKEETGCSDKYWHRPPLWKLLVVLTVFMQTQNWRPWPSSLKHLIVARLPHPGYHVDEESAERKQTGHPSRDPPEPWGVGTWGSRQQRQLQPLAVCASVAFSMCTDGPVTTSS